jgi:hypothetical protein
MSGYWLKNDKGSKEHGKYIEVREHGEAIIQKPEAFGFTQDEVKQALGGKSFNPQDTEKGSGRHNLLNAAFNKGWVRIRGSGPEWSAQLNGNLRDAAELIVELGEDDLGMGYMSHITLSDLASDTMWQGQLNRLFNEYDSLPNVERKEGEASATPSSSHRPSDEELRSMMRNRLTPAAAFYEELRRKVSRILRGIS